MSSNYEKIQEFHRVFGRIPDPTTPTITDLDSRILRATLILEEFEELLTELGLKLRYDVIDDLFKFDIISNHKIDLAKVAKEISDLLYVTYGTASSMGLPIDEVYNAVHESNMSKLGNNGEVIRREDGKVLKGPNYKEPDVQLIIERKL